MMCKYKFYKKKVFVLGVFRNFVSLGMFCFFKLFKIILKFIKYIIIDRFN